jgi:hypothetical protein
LRGPVIRALREAGHDVIAIAESATGASDEAVVKRAFNERRVLITEERDFGQLVYARGRFGGRRGVREGSRAARGAPSRRRWSKRWPSWACGCATASPSSSRDGCGWPDGRKSNGARHCTVSRASHSPLRNLTSWRLRYVAALMEAFAPLARRGRLIPISRKSFV